MARATDPALAMLAAVDLFAGLSAKDIRLIHEQGKEMTFREGEEITAQGRSGGRFFLILEGDVAISIHGAPRGTLGPGDYLGEISLIDGEPRAATAVATTPVRAWSLASFHFRPILRSYPSIAEKLLILLCRRLRDTEAARAAVR
jgi:CRP/FNR family transcriptional regulator, cyclic AMP receptor protein